MSNDDLKKPSLQIPRTLSLKDDANKAPMTADPSFNAAKCPIPNTHQRLRQAHLLWHQAATSYHEPELFLANVNSLIQELRNVTFILQSEKSRFSDFDAWYVPLQEKLKADKSSKWLHDTRNLVVKQGALRGSSFATIKLLTSDEIPVTRISISDGLTSEDILLSDEFKQKLPQIRDMASLDEDAVLIIEKSWSTEELEGREVLEVLAEVYGSLAAIVLDAHLNLGELGCISAYDRSDHPVHRDFPLLYDQSRRLRCMLYEATERSNFFRLSTLKALTPGRVNHSLNIEPWQVLERYGFDEPERHAVFEEMDPVALAVRIVYTSKKMLRKDRTHARIVWLRDGLGAWRQISIIAENRAEKHLVMHQLSDFVRAVGCDAFIEVGEMWTAESGDVFSQASHNLENHPARGEALAVQLATRDGLERSYSTPFTRGRDGGIKFGETDQLALFRTNHLAPIRRVWSEQRKPPQDSGTKILVWQPDILELCPCGGEKSFGVCCKHQLEDKKNEEEIDVRALLRDGQIEKAEKVARARVARYAIWIRQHTARSINADRYYAEWLTPVDAHALEHEIGLLEESVSAAGHSEAMLFTYRRLQEILGVPALARRVVSFAARWLIRAGRIEEGLLELDSLGEIGRSKDWLALTLAAQYGEYPDKELTKLLEKAVEAALESEERSLAFRHLAYHHYSADRPRAALDTISSFFSDATTNQEVGGSLKALRWHITQQDSDFDEALTAMGEAKGENETLRYVSWLMDTNHVSQALDLMKPLLLENNVHAMLLATECHLRMSDPTAASEQFDRIEASHLITPQLVHGYAHVQALLVLDGHRDDLHEPAVQNLKALPKDKSVAATAIEALLHALSVRAQQREKLS
jgi:hypothetical protein